mgnify:CR=1 FL=1
MTKRLSGLPIAIVVCVLGAVTVSAHDLLLSTVDLSAGGPSRTRLVVTVPLSELAKVEHAMRGAMTALDVEVAIRARLDVEPLQQLVRVGDG